MQKSPMRIFQFQQTVVFCIMLTSANRPHFISAAFTATARSAGKSSQHSASRQATVTASPASWEVSAASRNSETVPHSAGLSITLSIAPAEIPRISVRALRQKDFRRRSGICRRVLSAIQRNRQNHPPPADRSPGLWESVRQAKQYNPSAPPSKTAIRRVDTLQNHRPNHAENPRRHNPEKTISHLRRQFLPFPLRRQAVQSIFPNCQDAEPVPRLSRQCIQWISPGQEQTMLSTPPPRQQAIRKKCQIRHCVCRSRGKPAEHPPA